MARDLEKKFINRIMSLQRVGKVDRLSRSDPNGHNPSAMKRIIRAINGKCINGKEKR